MIHSPDKKSAMKLLLSICLLAAALLAFFQPPTNPDLHWHLSAGRYIINNHSLPRTEILSWTHPGLPWVDFEWLTQVIYYAAYSVSGIYGIFALKLAALSLALFFILRTAALYGEGNVCIIAPLWAAAALTNLDLRPDNFTLLFFAIELFLLEKIRISGSGVSVRKTFVIAAVAFALWGNMHAGFIYGAALALLYAAGRFWTCGTAAKEDTRLGFFTATALGGFIGPLLNPYGWGVYKVLVTHAGEMSFLSRYIREWMPPQPSYFFFPYWILLSYCAFVFIWHAFKHSALPREHYLALAFFGAMSAMHSRHIIFFATLALPFLENAARAGGERPLWKHIARWSLSAVASLYLIAWANDTINAATWNEIPVAGAAHYLADNSTVLSGLKLYNSREFGGYLGYALYPRYRIYQDGRYLFHDFIKPVATAWHTDAGWQKYMDSKDIGLAVIQRQHDDEILRQNSYQTPAYITMMPPEKWTLVYWDNNALVFVRNTAAPQQWLDVHGFSLVRPDARGLALEKIMNRYGSPVQLAAELAMLKHQLSADGAMLSAKDEIVLWEKLSAYISGATKN
jgi:hypothetical protein